MGLNKKSCSHLLNELKDEENFIGIFKKLYSLKNLSYKSVIINLFLIITIFCISMLVILQNNFKDIFFPIIDASLTMSVGILGFLIAGFSIFLSAIDKSFMYALILTDYKNKKISYYKNILLNFMEPFILFIVILLSVFLFRFLYGLKYLLPNNEFYIFSFKLTLIQLVKVISLSYMVYIDFLSLYVLKIFILNVYAILSTIAMQVVTQEFFKSNGANYSDFVKSLEDKLNDKLNE